MIKSAVSKARERASEIVLGTDNDLDGNKYVEKIWELALDARREVPHFIDCNEDVQE